MAGLTSAAGFLSLLEEKEQALQVYALQNLNTVVDEFWAEISDSIEQIEVLNEDDNFEAKDLAALVASKVYYHIGHFESAMIYALASGKLFDIQDDSQYTRTLVAKCIDEYIRQRKAASEEKPVVPHEDLKKVVEQVFDQSIKSGEYKYVLGIAIEARRLDRVEQIIRVSKSSEELLQYAYRACKEVITVRKLRQEILSLLVRLYEELGIKDWIRLCEILIFLDESKRVGKILCDLLTSSENDVLIAYQIAFDLCENASQQFRRDVYSIVVVDATTDKEQKEIQEFYQAQLKQKEEEDKKKQIGATDDSAMDTDNTADVTLDTEKSEDKKDTPKDEEHSKRIDYMKDILSGTATTNLYLQFLHGNNNTDKLVLKNIKTAMESKSSVVYSAIIIAHSYMNAGTTDDFFLRDNLEWLRLATNWSKFTATAGLGVVQKGHYKESMTIMAPYLPQQGVSSSPYSEGGALYALGLINANHGEEVTDYLMNSLRNAGTNEIVQHGACLGLGVAAMATRNMDIFEALRTVLFTDSAVAGEAAGMAMGLVMLGSANDDALTEMIAYAHDTQHEKIIRGLAIGVALIMCGREEDADTLVEQLIIDKDPILRYGGMYTIGLAYAGTSNNRAIKKLLHVAVSDVSDDVRRAAVTALGFLLYSQPDKCPNVVRLLAESYNPHVRYGATLAVGISCSGTGLQSAVDLLLPLSKDPVDFVRQGAFIALGMVLVQTSEALEPRVKKLRASLKARIEDKHEAIMAKFGACMASGILDAGGRNCTISPRSTTGHKKTTAIVGLAIFTQYWYWHPLAHFLSLALSPTAIIGLNKDSKMPVFSFTSNAKPSQFAYPEKVKPPTTKARGKLKAAELSITKKAKLRQSRKKGEQMEVDNSGSTGDMEVDNKEKDKSKKDDEKEEAEEKPEAEEEEPDSEVLNNPARVTPRQAKFISFDVDGRYTPVKTGEALGIVILKDNKPGEPEEFVQPPKPKIGTDTVGDEADEPGPPEPFEYDPAKESD